MPAAWVAVKRTGRGASELAHVEECGIATHMQRHLSVWALGFLASFAVAATGCAAGQGDTDRPEVSESELRSPASKVRALKSAVATANVPKNNDYGMSFAVKEYPRGTSVKKILEDVTGTDASEIDLASFDLSWGASGVKGFASVLESRAADELSDAEDDESQEAAKAIKGLASAVRRTFFPVSEFSAISSRSHSIQEDGDLESHTIIATKPDGSFLTMSYTNFPF